MKLGLASNAGAWALMAMLFWGVSVEAQQPQSEFGERELWFAVTADYNGLLTDASQERPLGRRGWAHVGALLDQLAREGLVKEKLVLLDAGDGLLGAASSVLPEEAGGVVNRDSVLPAVRIMNALGWDAMALGNYDWQAKGLRRAYGVADFAWLAANAWDAKDEPVFRPYVVLQRGGLRVGILGFGQPGISTQQRDWRGAWRMVDVRKGLRRWVPHLRQKEGVDVVVALMHSGEDPFYGWERAVTEHKPLPSVAGLVAWGWQLPQHAWPDLVLSGGSHRMSYAPKAWSDARWQQPSQPIPLLEVGSSGRGVMLVHMRLKATDSTRPHSPRWQPVAVSAAAIKVPPLPLQAALQQLPPPVQQRWQQAQRSLQQPSGWHFARNELSKRNRRPLARCLAHIQNQALAAALKDAKKPPLSLLPLSQRIYPSKWQKQQPVRRQHIYGWFLYADRLVQFHAQGQQIARLLEGMVRWQNNHSTRGLLPLYPGGMEFQLQPPKKPYSKSSNIIALVPHSPPDSSPLQWRTSYPLWSTDFIRQGYNSISSRALLKQPPILQQLPSSLRELVFQFMQPQHPPPKNCQRFFTR